LECMGDFLLIGSTPVRPDTLVATLLFTHAQLSSLDLISIETDGTSHAILFMS
jgi:hypothetical protein